MPGADRTGVTCSACPDPERPRAPPKPAQSRVRAWCNQTEAVSLQLILGGGGGIWLFVPQVGMQSNAMGNFAVQGEDMDCQESVRLPGTPQGAEPGPGPIQRRSPDPLAHPGVSVMGHTASLGHGHAEPSFGSKPATRPNAGGRSSGKILSPWGAKSTAQEQFFPSRDCAGRG